MDSEQNCLHIIFQNIYL